MPAMSSPGEPVAPRRWALGVAAIVAAVQLGLISHGHFAGSGDAVHYMVIARSLVLDHDLDLANDYSDSASLILNGHLEPEAHTRPGRDGRLRPVHDIGWPLVSAPAFAAAQALAEHVGVLPQGLRVRARLDGWIALRQLVCMCVIAVSALLAMLLFHALHSLGHSTPHAAGAALFLVLTGPLLTMGYVYMTEVPTALAAFWLVLRLRRGLPSVAWHAACVGFGIGFLVLVHARNVGLALGLAAIALSTKANGRSRSALALGVALAFLLRTAINFAFWGQWFTTPHAQLGAFAGLGALLSESATRLLGLLFDQRHGLVPQAPAALLVPAGWIVLRRREPRLAGWVFGLGAAYLAFVLCPLTNVHGWRGGFSPAARFLVPILPLLGLCVAEAALASRIAFWWAAPFAALQGLVAVGFWRRPMLSWAEGAGAAPWLEAWGLAPLTSILPAWDPASPWALPATAALVAVSVVLAIVIPRQAR
jgi:hypothetical protein